MAIFGTDTNRKSDGDGRVAFIPAPKYQCGVLEEGWQYRCKDDVLPQADPRRPPRETLPPFKGCSIYQTSYRRLPTDCYTRDLSAWTNRGKAETSGISEGDEAECRENFTTTTDLVYRILPQICPRMREYNSNSMEWFPSQNFLPCYGNLTQYGLKEKKKHEWAVHESIMNGSASSGNTAGTDKNSLCMPATTYWDHYRKPPQNYLVTYRRAISRQLSSQLEPNNKMMEPKSRGSGGLRVPIVDFSTIPMPECRFPLPILPTLPEEPPYRIKVGKPAEIKPKNNNCYRQNPQPSSRVPVC